MLVFQLVSGYILNKIQAGDDGFVVLDPSN